jgi:hypothetical protein
MSPEEAQKIIIQALDQAFKQGVYSLQDAKFIVDAISIITQEQETKN